MHPLIADKLEVIRAACLEHGVARLSLFGSAAGEAFDPSSSDLDFLVEFLPCSPAEHYERYFGLREALVLLFDREIDLVEPGAMRNPYFILRVTESAVSLYAA